MLDISFEVNGKKVNPKNMGDALGAAMLSGIADSVKKSVGSVRCPTHGQAPKIKVKGRSIDNLSFEVTGCCDDLIEKVKGKLK